MPTFTDQGCIALGELIRFNRTSRSWSLEKLQHLLSGVGVEVSESTLQRLERPQPGKHPDWELVNAIAYLGFVKQPRSFATEELMLIACEWIDPKNGRRIQGTTVMSEGSPNAFVALVQKQYPMPDQLVAASGLTQEEAVALYQGQMPDVTVVGFLADILRKEDGSKYSTEELLDIRDEIFGMNSIDASTNATHEEHNHHVGNGAQ